MSLLLIVRPQPGASETAMRAAALGLEAVVAPIFRIRPVPWQAPDPETVDAVMLTSANAVRHAGDALQRFTRLPCYVVGEGTGRAARQAGFADIRPGSGDGAALLSLMAEEGVARPLHPCGRDHKGLAHAALSIVRHVVYAADELGPLTPQACQALASDAVVLLHSPRAASHFAALADDAGCPRAKVSVAAISAAAADAAGDGWMEKQVAREPGDEALLELALKLCKTRPR